MSSSEASVLRAVNARLTGNVVTGDRVFAEGAQGEARPYIVYFTVDGGAEYVRSGVANERIILNVKCVADTLSMALAGQEVIRMALDDSGSQDVRGLAQLADADWEILTVTRDRVVSITERFEGAKPIYHRGYVFVFELEEK